MKSRLSNDSGAALVTALMLTLISLAIVMALLYMVTEGTKQSAAQRRYHSVLEASYGSIDLFGRDLLPRIIVPAMDGTLGTAVEGLTSTTGTVNFSSIELELPTDTACFQQKLTETSDAWSSCAEENHTSNPKQSPDMEFVLAGTDNVGYKVSAKIVATLKGNTDVTSLATDGKSSRYQTGGGVVDTSAAGGGGGGIILTHYPYMYTLEIQGEKETNPEERSRLTVLYAF